MFVLSFKNGNIDPTRDFFDNFYTPLVETKDSNALIQKKKKSWSTHKNKQEAYEKLVHMQRYDDYTIGNLLHHLYHQSYYKRIGTDLARQTNTTITQQINFTEKLEKDDDATRSFIVKEQKSYN